MAKQRLKWIDKSDPNTTATTDEDPRRTEHVHAWIFKNGQAFNRAIVSSKWFLGEFRPEEQPAITDGSGRAIPYATISDGRSYKLHGF